MVQPAPKQQKKKTKKKKHGKRGFKRKPRASVNPDMNVTPLVDVVLVLLIIFMVLAPVVNAHYLGRLPPPDNKDEALAQANPDSAPLVLRVEGSADSDEVTYKLGSEELRFDEAPARIGRLVASRPDKVLYVDASDTTPYGQVLQAMSFAADSEGVVNKLVAETLGKTQAELPRIRVTAVLVTQEIPVD